MAKVIREYHGMSWDSREQIVFAIPIDATMAIDRDTKLVMEKAKASFNFHKNSFKYNPQVVLAVYSRLYPAKQKRAYNNDWARNEIMFPISVATRDFFLECARIVDAKLKRIM